MEIGSRGEHHGRGAHMVLRRGEQMMLKLFEVIKHNFAGRPPPGQPVLDDVIELPPGIGVQDNPANNIRDGQLFITWYKSGKFKSLDPMLMQDSDDLEEMFRESVEGTLELINQQLVQIDRLRLRARASHISSIDFLRL